MYCACCKKYEETDADPLENIQKFMDFIKRENEKINPPKRKPVKKKQRHPEMPDDSISEVTDLEQEAILSKYYGEVVSKIEKRKAERLAARRRLWGETMKMKEERKPKHMCKGPYFIGPNDPKIPVEVKKRSDGLVMQDEDQSAHQFSRREMSAQADEEEIENIKMQVSAWERDEHDSAPEGSLHSRRKIFSSKQSTSQLTNKTILTLTALDSKKMDRKASASLLQAKARTRSKGIQTEEDNKKRKLNKQLNKFNREGHSVGFSRDLFADPDDYARDWQYSLVYKRAMQAEAIRRGEHIASEFQLDEEEDNILMTVTHPEESHAVFKRDGGKQSVGAQKDQRSSEEDHVGSTTDFEDLEGHNIGFMKRFST
jgi:hypothetical protein